MNAFALSKMNSHKYLDRIKILTLLLSLIPTLALAIDSPHDVRGVVITGDTVKWEWATPSDAVRYDVIINNEFVAQVTNSHHYSRGLEAGDYSLTVKAITSNWEYSQPSEAVRITIGAGSNTAPSPSNPEDQVPPASSGDAIPAPLNDAGIIDPQTWSQPNVDKEGYELVFSDEFNNDRLSRERWNTQLRWDGEFNGERYEYRRGSDRGDHLYVNIYSEDQDHLDKVVPVFNPFEFNGSRLAIRAIVNPMKVQKKEKPDYGPLDRMFGQATFLSGVISTYDKFTQRFGYFEARIKIPNQVGAFPAFWLHHQKRKKEGTQRTEIDIVENLGHAPWYIYSDFHYFTGVTEYNSGTYIPVDLSPSGQYGNKNGTDFSKDYHVFAAEWNPGHIQYFIDGEKISEIRNDNIDYEDLYILMNLAVGGNWTNFPTNAGGLGRETHDHFPNQNDIDNWSNPALEIDYVRAYKRR